jgi:16S rRNA (cytosine1402-N4)-methyltransferase
MHTSVFLTEAVDALAVTSGGLYIDATYGQGGHSKEIIKRGGTVLALDLDVQENVPDPQNGLRVVRGNFQDIEKIAHDLNIPFVDGVIFDFGLSMNQLSEGGKGLSFKKNDEPLDMRLSGEGMTAADIVNTYSKEELTEVFMRYAEDPNGERYAVALVQDRKNRKIVTVGDFLETLKRVVEQVQPEKMYSRIFQALRIVVNEEFNTIPNGMKGAMHLVKEGGRIVTITFHSLEDRWVKRFVKEHRNELSDERINVERMRPLRPFERSATLRVMTKRI